MSREIELNRIITEKIENLDVDNEIKSFIYEILNFEKSIANREGRVMYSDEYQKIIDKFEPKEE